MPPKGTTRAVADGNSSGARRNVSIASFFDAAAVQRNRNSGRGRGFHIAPSPDGDSHLTSSSDRANQTRAAPPVSHWSTLSSTGGSDGGTAGESVQSHHSTLYSAPLEEVKKRILAEFGEESDAPHSRDHGRESALKLQQHRQRALHIAFGGGSGGAGSGAAGSGQSPEKRGSSSTSRVNGGGGTVEEDEEELQVSAVEFSLVCPYSRLAMRLPVRSSDCRHVQCCDLESWMVLLEKYRSLRDPKGPCPVCEQRVSASSLEVDLWMLNVMEQMPAGTHLVVLNADGSYRSGDTAREQRKAHLTTEVVDATQGDFENYLGEVIDDDTDEVQEIGDASTPSTFTETHPGGKRARPLEQPASLQAAEGVTESLTPYETQGRVKRERVSPGRVAEAVTPPQVSQGDSGVVIVEYVEGYRRNGRALPSQVRLWVPHCTQCGTPLLKGEDGHVEACGQCGLPREQWTLVRRFEESAKVSLELTPDGTLILHGVDGAAAFLFRAGFQRTPFHPEEYVSVESLPQYKPPVGIWVSSFPLSRFEIDFLEACCLRLAQGRDLDDFDGMMVPNLFRIPRRRKQTTTGRVAWPASSSRAPGVSQSALSQRTPPDDHAHGLLYTQGGSVFTQT